ncbi:hypothetical protein OS493_026294 [Desmophyllum pertusum]|uniref:Uncharacterized protein n=1 Tax=Desmophyllum pertusum TaxID=174260 RepID=A0A9W9ZL74_9CNID|nr:hypothetical protein OS493_026294 [Desmophyllum pertusum]
MTRCARYPRYNLEASCFTVNLLTSTSRICHLLMFSGKLIKLTPDASILSFPTNVCAPDRVLSTRKQRRPLPPKENKLQQKGPQLYVTFWALSMFDLYTSHQKDMNRN